MVRIPNKDEADVCTRLIRISGPELFEYIYGFPKDELLAFLSLCYHTPGTTFFRETILIDEEDGNIRGLILGHPVARLRKYLRKEMGNIIRYHGSFFKAIPHLMTMISHAMIAIHYPRLHPDEYFIANLAVFEEYRGKGISSTLIREAEQLASIEGLAKLVLYVESDNEHAIAVYRHYGFEEVSRSLFPERYHRFGLQGFIKMSKNL